MSKILSVKSAIETSKKLHKQGKKIVLAGGCFDILHIGHMIFLQKAKKLGGVLFLLLESDESVFRLKGKNRPVNSQADRALLLICLEMVDYVVKLSPDFSDKDYDQLVVSLKPAIIATTKGDAHIRHKKRQASLMGAKVLSVTRRIIRHSTSTTARKIAQEFIL